MKYSIQETGEKVAPYKLFRYDEYAGIPNNAELEFWFEIERLKRELSMRDSVSEEDYMLRKALGEELRAAKEKIQELERINEIHSQFYSLLKAKFEMG